MPQLKFTVRLNGTNENPFTKFGLKQNPFPQLGDMKWDSHLLYLLGLGADPIPNKEYIFEYLKGWSEEFVEGVAARFVPGKMVEFVCTFEV